jgi:hypothetical protein
MLIPTVYFMHQGISFRAFGMGYSQTAELHELHLTINGVPVWSGPQNVPQHQGWGCGSGDAFITNPFAHKVSAALDILRSWEFGFIHQKFVRAVESDIACYTDVEMQIPQAIWDQVDKTLEEQKYGMRKCKVKLPHHLDDFNDLAFIKTLSMYGASKFGIQFTSDNVIQSDLFISKSPPKKR